MGFFSKNGKYNQLGKVLETKKYFSRNQFNELLDLSKKENRHLVEVIFEYNTVEPEKILKVFSQYYKTPAIILRNRVISNYVLNLIPKEVAEQHSVIIFKKIKNIIFVATTNPENTQTIEFIKKKTGFEPKIFITSPHDIKHALNKYKSEISQEFAKIIQDSIAEAMTIHDTAENMAHHVPVINMVNTVIEKALSQNASDIHLEPNTTKVTIRFRIDGFLHKIVELPKDILPAFVTRIKIMSNLKIDEHRLPQDGRFKYLYNDKEVAVRVSAVPTLHGTKIVLRLLDTKENLFTLKRLGLNQKDFNLIKKEITHPHGMILSTGPTGSGKTTTLYTLLHLLNKEDVNICTIEDPIEYGIEGINQTQINPTAGLTFANGLKSFLRQDPNIIMVGEIRDFDTAEIAINAAMTGHLVLSTLHTNDAFLAIQRLVEMGIQPFLAASVVNIIIAQRLVRRICPDCKTQAGLNRTILERNKKVFNLPKAFTKLKKYNLMPKDCHNLSEIKFYQGRGCPKCNGTGYRGRVGIYEILKIDKKMYQTILKNPSADSIKKAALKQGVLTMIEDGILKVFEGKTTLDEVLRVTKE